MKVYCNECLGSYPLKEGEVVFTKVYVNDKEVTDEYETSFYCKKCYSTLDKSQLINIKDIKED